MHVYDEVTNEVPQGSIHRPVLLFIILYMHNLLIKRVNNMYQQQIVSSIILNSENLT